MSGLTDTWTTPHEQYGGIFRFVVVIYLRLKKWSPFTSILLNLAATLLTPETPEVFCGLEPFTHPSVALVASREWEHSPISVNYPFKDLSRECRQLNTK